MGAGSIDLRIDINFFSCFGSHGFEAETIQALLFAAFRIWSDVCLFKLLRLFSAVAPSPKLDLLPWFDHGKVLLATLKYSSALRL